MAQTRPRTTDVRSKSNAQFTTPPRTYASFQQGPSIADKFHKYIQSKPITTTVLTGWFGRLGFTSTVKIRLTKEEILVSSERGVCTGTRLHQYESFLQGLHGKSFIKRLA